MQIIILFSIEAKDAKESKTTVDDEEEEPQTKASSEHVDDSMDEHFSDESDEDYSDCGNDEGKEGYRQGGYHPVNIGEIYNTRYTVIEKLGWGHFSTVWMVYDKKSKQAKNSKGSSNTPPFVALKIQKSAPHYREAAVDEVKLLDCISNATRTEAAIKEYGPNYKPPVVYLLDHFEHTGPHGKHFCMVFEMLGENLLEVIKKYDYKGIPLHIVRRLVEQIVVGLCRFSEFGRVIVDFQILIDYGRFSDFNGLWLIFRALINYCRFSNFELIMVGFQI